MPAAVPLVSVLLPVYNGAAFVEQAIRSIQSQCFRDWELVILDDGSSDSSYAVCHALAAEDARIRLERSNANLGLASAMNRLTALARGQYLAVQEQDDVSMPDRLECEVTVLGREPGIGLVSGVAEWLDDTDTAFARFPGILHRGGQYPQGTSEMVAYLYTEQCKVVNAACMFRRSVLESVPGPYDENARMSIDWQFFIHVAHRHRIWGIPRVLVRMRRGAHHSSLTKRKELQFREARRCIRLVHGYYRGQAGSPINHRLYRRAMATQLVLEGRFYGRGKGLGRLLGALAYDPGNRAAWSSVWELVRRGGSAGRRSRRPVGES